MRGSGKKEFSRGGDWLWLVTHCHWHGQCSLVGAAWTDTSEFMARKDRTGMALLWLCCTVSCVVVHGRRSRAFLWSGKT